MKTNEPKLYGTYNALQVGDRGMQITLPSTYCKLNGVKPGTPIDVYVIEETACLLLQPQKEEKP